MTSRFVMVLTLMLVVVLVPGPGTDLALAQPAPSFKASCEGVDAALEKLNPTADQLVTIEVEDKLTLIEFDGVIAYLGMCGTGKPHVMCISYSTEGWKVGDRAILSGGYNHGESGAIILDPCLPYPAGG